LKFFILYKKGFPLNKLLVCILVFMLAMAASAAVKKKRFDVGGGEAPAATEMVTPNEGASAVPEAAAETAVAKSVAAVPEKSVEKTRSLYTVIAEEQKVLREKLTAAISAMKSGDWEAIWKFLAICLVYGMLHALGPGHGKSIVVGYFIARRGRWRQGVALGAGITVTHTMSAVILLLILYAIFKATVFTAFETGRIGIERASYALIMLTGVLLVVLAIRDVFKSHKGCGCSARLESAEGAVAESKLPPVARWREILGVAAVTGIVPCPAVALIVLFCLLNSMVALSLLGALVICIGMTITNVAFGIAAVAFRKGIDKGSAHTRIATKIYTVATLAGGVIIFISGLLLFTNQFAGRV
jgi:ABC-type nickel/cobalt efflux system permease component RcnA